MRPVFVKPADLKEKSYPTLSLVERLRRIPLKAVNAKNLASLESCIELFESYRQLPLGMNLVHQEQFKKTLKDTSNIRSLPELTQELHERACRYAWDFNATTLLNQETFWSEAGQACLEEKTFWEQAHPYAYYRSEDLRFISEHVLPKIDVYWKKGKKEYHEQYTSENKYYLDLLDDFYGYLLSLKENIVKERRRIAQAMLVRLELASQYQDLSYDDVLYDISHRLNQRKVHFQSLGIRPYTVAQRGLTSDTFHYFHRYIMKYGDAGVQKRCQQLPWVKKRYYLYHEKRRSWSTANVISGVNIPRFKWWPKRLFRGRVARYEAFHDVTRILNTRNVAERTQILRERFQKQSAQEHTTEDYALLHRNFVMLQQEYTRIVRLSKGLLPPFHRKSYSALKIYRDELRGHIEYVVMTQFVVLKKAQEALSTSTVQNQKDLLDRFLMLADHLEQEVACFDQKYQIIIDSNTKQKQSIQTLVTAHTGELRRTIATQKINNFLLSLHNKTFKQSRLPETNAVATYLDSLFPYLLPNQVIALKCLQRVMEGDYGQGRTALSYNELYQAAQALTPNPKDILQLLFDRFILPSIIVPNTVGYQLLQAYEKAFPEEHKRSQLLKPVEADEQKALFASLETLFAENDDWNQKTKVRVNDHIMLLDIFRKRISLLEPRAVRASVKTYLQETYQGQDEHLWPIFSVLPDRTALSYGYRRFQHLLETGAITRVHQSSCLSDLAPLLKRSRRVQKALKDFLQTTCLTDQALESIDTLVDRFADKASQTFWHERRAQYLSERIISVMQEQNGNTSVLLQDYLTRHSDWLTPQSRDSLVSAWRQYPLTDWTDAKHAILNTLKDKEFKQIYYIKLLKRIVSDRDFAIQHSGYLPDEDHIIERLELMSTPEFHAICAEVLDRFHQQLQIDHVAAVRVLESLLRQGVGMTVGLGGLVEKLDRLIGKQDYLHVEWLAEETIHSIRKINWQYKEGGDCNNALRIIRRLRKIYDDYQSLGNEKEQACTARSLQHVLTVVDQCWRKDPTTLFAAKKALNLIEPMNCLKTAEPLLWYLRRYKKLDNIVPWLQDEITRVGQGKPPFLLRPLPLLCEAMERGVYQLLDEDQESIIVQLRFIIESIDFRNLWEPTQHLLKAVLRFFEPEEKLSEKDRDILKKHELCLPSAFDADDPAPISTPPQEICFIPFTATTTVSQQITDQMQEGKLSESLALMRQVFTDKNSEQKKAVCKDLLGYLRNVLDIACDFDKKREDPLRVQAKLQIEYLRSCVNALTDSSVLNADDVLVLLARNAVNFENLTRKFLLSLKFIVDHGQRDCPELGRLVFYYIKFEFVSTEYQQWLVQHLSQNLLPKVDQGLITISPQLIKALRSFLAAVKGKGTLSDEQNIIAYENYYRDVVQPTIAQMRRLRWSAAANSNSLSVQQRNAFENAQVEDGQYDVGK